jgi:release factor glutamine methyltransferase
LTAAEALRRAAEVLERKGRAEARLEAEVLLMHALGWDRARLYAHGDEPLPPEAAARFDEFVERRRRGEPVAYIVGHKEFFGLDFVVDQRVLQPRAETEMLVEAALAFIRERFGAAGAGCTVADVGTGSGCIAVALALNLPAARLWATDISAEAVAVAAINLARHGVDGRVRLAVGDMLAPLPEAVDVLVADLPYVPEFDLVPVIDEIPTSVFLGEPIVALSGGADGLDKIAQFLSEAPPKLRSGGAFFLEMSWEQGKAVAAMCQRAFPEARVTTTKDLAGWERMVAVYM